MSPPIGPIDAPSPPGEGDDSAAIARLLDQLGGEIRRPLELLREGVCRLLDDTSRPISDPERDQARVMLGLCDDLDRLTRETLQGGHPVDA